MLKSIVRQSNAPGRGTFAEIPRMNHHFARFPEATAAYAEKNGEVNPAPAVDVMLAWLRKVLGRAT
jgi:hypothetical protein